MRENLREILREILREMLGEIPEKTLGEILGNSLKKTGGWGTWGNPTALGHPQKQPH